MECLHQGPLWNIICIGKWWMAVSKKWLLQNGPDKNSSKQGLATYKERMTLNGCFKMSLTRIRARASTYKERMKLKWVCHWERWQCWPCSLAFSGKYHLPELTPIWIQLSKRMRKNIDLQHNFFMMKYKQLTAVFSATQTPELNATL